jgi:hypothetical protein
VRWLANRDRIPVETFEPTRAEIVAALVQRFTFEQIKVANVLRGVAPLGRRTEELRVADVDAEASRVLGVLSKTPGLQGVPLNISDLEGSVRRLLPQLGDWRQVPSGWLDPAPEPPPTWLTCSRGPRAISAMKRSCGRS